MTFFLEQTFKCESLPTREHPVSIPQFAETIVERTKICTTTLVVAMFYLIRLKQKHPRCKGSLGSGFRLLLSAIILAAKYLYDDTYDNSAWATVSSGMFKLEQVNQMEMEMLGFLEFQLFIKVSDWQYFYQQLGHRISRSNQKMSS